MATRKDVARRAEVSEGTVSHVITGNVYVKDEKKERVLQAIKELNYIPDQNARSLVTNKSDNIGIAIYETTNPYHMEIAKKIEEFATTKGYIVSLFMLDNNMEDKLRIITERRVDGFVNFMTNRYPSEFINALKSRGTELVNFDSSVGPMFLNDYTSAMTEVLQKLKELGHKNLAYISTLDEKNFAVDTRGKTWFAETEKLGFNKCKVYYNHEFNLPSDKTGNKLAKKMIAEYKNVTAVFCTNDLSAMGCLRALSDAGLKVPQDISVIGCDNIALSEILVPSLTTLDIDKARQGYDIARQIIERTEPGTNMLKIYEAKAIFRESVSMAKKW